MRRARSLLVLIALVLLIPFALAHNSDQHGPGKKHPPREMPPGRKSLVTGVTADPNPFSPNADGRLDASTIAVEAVVKAVDGLHARDHDRDDGDDGRASFYFAATAVIGDDVRRLRARSEIPRTHDRSVRVQTETAFDGNDETGRLLPDGDYDSTVLAFFLRERIKQGALSGEARSRLDDSIDALAGERNATIGLESKFEKRRKGRGEGSWRAEVRVDGIGKALRHKIRPLIEALEAALVAARQEVKAKIKLIDSEVVDGNALTIDTTAPALVSLLPPDGFASPSPEVEIAGSLSEPATLSINDLPIPLLPDLSFSATFPLSGGANLFAITAEDLAGNRTETSRTYLFDVTPPFIDIAEPIPGSFVPNNLPTIRVVYSDPEPSSGLDLSSLAILLDGTPLPLTPDRIGPTEAIFVPTNPLNDGEHTIEATISDKAPNVGTAGPYAFSIDTLPPTLTLSEPPDWLVTNRLSTLVSGTSSEAGTVTVNSRTFPLAFAETGGLTGVTGFIFPPALTPDTTSPTGYVLSQSPLSYQGRDFDQLPNDEGGIIEDVALFLPTGFEPGGSEPPPILMQSFTPVPVDGLVAVHLALVEGSAGDRVTIYTTMERTELEAFLAMVDPVGATIWLYRQDAFLPQG
ncbi:MAG: hypothetical protein HYY13_06300, partial [Nitrospirae bacterium]|nr:hypothetical protein [Nitrospirota bacterium]